MTKGDENKRKNSADRIARFALRRQQLKNILEREKRGHGRRAPPKMEQQKENNIKSEGCLDF
ncbi:TPA: hypothetical protein DDW35_06245 [Candidatus Sumerlaeota bacterium]|jgi:hypothetical protein|nr:hypothetical protein [Candidatus Sumerlaeota bacterium]